MAQNVTPLPLSKVNGRPRRLLINDVINAAAEIGIDAFSMTSVAAKLGVAVGTLYTYVDGVDDLRRMVASRQARRPLIEERGQHWADIVEENTRTIYGAFAAEPYVIRQFVTGDLSAEGLAAELEQFLGLLQRRGFAVPLAIRIFHQSASIALGAAAAVGNAAGLQSRGISTERALRRDFADHDPKTMPILAEWLETYLAPGVNGVVDGGIVFLIQSIAALRGEELPKATLKRLKAIEPK